MKQVLLVNGSPHENGCVFTALSEIQSQLTKDGVASEIFQLSNRPVRGCIDCRACKKTGRCAFSDDVCNALLEKMLQADGVILGSPVYYAGANGALCAVLDRVFRCSGGRFDGKPAAAVVSSRRGGASATFDRLNKYFTISNMPVVPSQYWNSVHGNTPDEVRQDAEGLQIMRALADNMAWMLGALDGRPHPQREPRVGTNFIR